MVVWLWLLKGVGMSMFNFMDTKLTRTNITTLRIFLSCVVVVVPFLVLVLILLDVGSILASAGDSQYHTPGIGNVSLVLLLCFCLVVFILELLLL